MNTPLAVLLSAWALVAQESTPAPATAAHTAVTRVAFGSCQDQNRPQSMLERAARLDPALFLFLGDNVYADTGDELEMRAAYAALMSGSGMAALAERGVRVLATWDDHDYGVDDGGAAFAARELSQRVFCDAWGESESAPRRARAGIYEAVMLGGPERRVQVVLLDTRFHRSPLRRASELDLRRRAGRGPYVPDPDPDATMLGEQQWRWLEEQLRLPARLRLVCSSIQFVAGGHGYECWDNLPREKERMLALIARTRANGVVFLSGDRHHAEISCLPAATDGRGPAYPIWDVTSSSLTTPRAWVDEPNLYRRTSVYWQPNFGVLDIEWDGPEPAVSLQIHGEDGLLFAERVPLAALEPSLKPRLDGEERLERLAFVSCVKQSKPQPLWQPLLDRDPQLLVMLGDNVYGDTEDMAELQAAYDELAANPLFARVRARVPIVATWDDHDLGRDDAGIDYPLVEASKARFLDFFGVPADDVRRRRPGVYRSFYYGPPAERVQVLVLDTRSFRTPLSARTTERPAGHAHPGRYVPSFDPTATMLGDAQWRWLERELRVPAAVRVICSSIQVLSEGHGWECWANLPLERARLFRAIRDARATGVLIVSGDMHIGEHMAVAPHDTGVPYTLHEFTSSGLNQGWEFTNYHNEHRVGTPMFDPNFGWIEIDWEALDPRLTIRVERADRRQIRGELRLSELR